MAFIDVLTVIEKKRRSGSREIRRDELELFLLLRTLDDLLDCPGSVLVRSNDCEVRSDSLEQSHASDDGSLLEDLSEDVSSVRRESRRDTGRTF
jgi:hypothetical protein